jgi:excisionase family DNA binding protein
MGNTRQNPLESMERLLIRVKEASYQTGIPLSTLYQMVNGGEIPVVRRGRSIRIPVKALHEWIERQTRAAA